MAPLIDQELEKIDRRHAQLTRLGGELVEALNMYHNLMREPVGMNPAAMPYGMRMGMNVPPGPTVSMPQFSQAGGSVQYPGYLPYDPNVPSTYPMMRPPHSAPAATESGGYNSMPYQPSPQSHSMGQQQMTNGQIGPQQLIQSPHQVNQQVNMTSAGQGQVPYSQPMMMPQGQNMNMQGYDSNPMSQQQQQSQMGGMPPHMMAPQKYANILN